MSLNAGREPHRVTVNGHSDSIGIIHDAFFVQREPFMVTRVEPSKVPNKSVWERQAYGVWE
jgi:hypothetical protein